MRPEIIEAKRAKNERIVTRLINLGSLKTHDASAPGSRRRDAREVSANADCSNPGEYAVLKMQHCGFYSRRHDMVFPTATIKQITPAETLGLSGTPLDQLGQAATIDGHEQIALYSSSSFVWGQASPIGTTGQYLLAAGDIVVGGSNLDYHTVAGYFVPTSGTITSVQIALPGAVYVGGFVGAAQLQITGLNIDVASHLLDIAQAFTSGNTSALEAILDEYIYNYTGSAGNDSFEGGIRADVINGGAGADLMRGGAGNDTYFVDNANDVVDESVAGSDGFDRVQSSITINLSDAVHFKGAIEMGVLTGSANVNLTGNGLNNLLVGNTGDNFINGGAGADTMQGGAGNDT
jgi:Ca2+-binding RTX toxin-like protein